MPHITRLPGSDGCLVLERTGGVGLHWWLEQGDSRINLGEMVDHALDFFLLTGLDDRPRASAGEFDGQAVHLIHPLLYGAVGEDGQRRLVWLNAAGQLTASLRLSSTEYRAWWHLLETLHKTLDTGPVPEQRIELCWPAGCLSINVSVPNWWRCRLIEGERSLYLGAEGGTILRRRLLEGLSDGKAETADDDPRDVHHVVTVSAPYSALYCTVAGEIYTYFWMRDGYDQRFGQVRLSPEGRRAWRDQLAESDKRD